MKRPRHSGSGARKSKETPCYHHRFKRQRRLQQQLPVELELNILLRLPVKALGRCRSVCKRWDEEIKSPHFINLYYQQNTNSSKNNQVLLVSEKSYNLLCIDFCCIQKDVNSNSFPLAVHDTVPTNPWVFCFCIENFISSCNGLLCYRDLRRIAVYNPTTKSSRFIPLPFQIVLEDVFGFGYDSVTQDYKILHVSYASCQSTIFSLKNHSTSFVEHFPFQSKNKFGGSIEPFPFESKITGGIMVYFNNALHWRPFLSYSATVTCFDLGTDKYYELPLPACDDDLIVWDLVDLRGCLHLSHYTKRREIHVWIMKVYGIKESWTKLFSLSREQVHTNIVPLGIGGVDDGGLCLSKPYAYSKDGRQVIVGIGTRLIAFLSIDLCTKKLRKIKIGGLPDDWSGQFRAMTWVASHTLFPK